MSASELEQYLASLPPQRLILRAVDELRPTTAREGHSVTIGRVTFVEVVTVSGGQRVMRKFDGARMEDARAIAKARGHTILERTGNIT